MKVLVLVAGAGRRLWGYSRDPKCLLTIGGVPLIHRYLDALDDLGPLVAEVVLVVGYQADEIRRRVGEHRLARLVRYVRNERYDKGSILSLAAGLEAGGETTLLMDGDVYFEPAVLQRLIDAPADDAFLVDTRSQNTGEEIMVGADDGGRIVRVGRGMSGHFDVYGEWIGFLKASPSASRELARLVSRRIAEGATTIGYEDLLDEMIATVPSSACLVDGLHWVEIDFPQDVELAKQLAAAGPSDGRQETARPG
jgi:choline kinase